MIIDIAIAREGFINLKDTIVEPTNKNNFLEILKGFFNFEKKDLLGFDGVRCDIEHEEDPTNSIFIYENDTGTFLYQIQSATPKIHKNKLIWSCGVYQMETMSQIQNVIDMGTSFLKLQNGIALNSEYNLFNKSSQKNNFIPVRKMQLNLGASSGSNAEFCIYTLKIKCYVDPTNTGLVSNSEDGSFVFYFPIVCKLDGVSFTSSLTYNDVTITLQNIISTFSNNIKSIEVLPFFVNSTKSNNLLGYSYTITPSKTSDNISITLMDVGFAFTACGIFVKQANNSGVRRLPKFYTSDNIPNVLSIGINNQLALGGGVSAFFRTPTGVIPLDFEFVKTTDNYLSVIELDEGFIVCGGGFSARIPPTFINFYTDSSGTIFINQQTNYKYEQQQMQLQQQQMTTQKAFSSGKSFLGNLFSGDFGGAFGDLLGFGTGAIEQQIDYDFQKQSFQNKVSNETALAKLTGKHLGGNTTMSDLFEKLSNNFFALIIEYNYFTDSDNKYHCQKDFDYSVNYESGGIEFEIRDFRYLYDYFINNIFANNCGANYNFMLSFENKENTKNFTNIINLPIRF